LKNNKGKIEKELEGEVEGEVEVEVEGEGEGEGEGEEKEKASKKMINNNEREDINKQKEEVNNYIDNQVVPSTHRIFSLKRSLTINKNKKKFKKETNKKIDTIKKR